MMKSIGYSLRHAVSVPLLVAAASLGTIGSSSSAIAADAANGKKLWEQPVTVAGEKRACTSCHGKDLTQPGQHAKTQKVIEPMAKSVTSDRYEDPKKVAKWFLRNCKWTWGRTCTDTEQDDILAYLTSQ